VSAGLAALERAVQRALLAGLVGLVASAALVVQVHLVRL
jgi:hypothetical protein